MKTHKSTRLALNLAITAALTLCLFINTTVFLVVCITWTSLALCAVGLAYKKNFGRLFRKRSDGRIPLYIRWVFFPFLIAITFYNYFKRKFDSVPPVQKISDALFVGARLSNRDTDLLKSLNIQAVLDVTAEFDGLGQYSDADISIDYLNIPILDHAVPNEIQIGEASRWIHDHRVNNKNVLVHCALGRGRSVLFAATYLISIGEADSLEQAMSNISGVRLTARLNRLQTKMVTKWMQSQKIKPESPDKIYIIANPVAGGGKWPEYKEDVIARLKKRYQVCVLETTETVTAKKLTADALTKGAKIVVACGGDGTLAEVAGSLVNSSVKFGLIPCGTANSVAQSILGWESKLNPVDAACDAILGGEIRTIDYALCNDEYSLLVVAIGLESDMIHYATREEKDKYGCLAYCLGFIDSLRSIESNKYEVTLDSKSPEFISAKSLVVANAAPTLSILAQGNGEPNMQDGLLDITILHENGNFGDNVVALSSLINTAASGVADSTHIDNRKASSIKITSDKDIPYVIDGEARQSKCIEVKVIANAIKIFSNPPEPEIADGELIEETAFR